MLNTVAPYRILDIEQNTPRWTAWRLEGIGSTCAAAILGESKYRSAEDVFREKCGLAAETPTTEAMLTGIALEPTARAAYEAHTGVRVPPACLQSTRHEWQIASVDGLAADGRTVVEIKCGRGVFWSTARSMTVPSYYIGQLQHILAVTGLPGIDFWCYWPDYDPVHLLVERDERYIRRLTDAEWALWKRIESHRKQQTKGSTTSRKAPKIPLGVPIVAGDQPSILKVSQPPRSHAATAGSEKGPGRPAADSRRSKAPMPPRPQGTCVECATVGDVFEHKAQPYCRPCHRAEKMGWSRGSCHQCGRGTLLKQSYVYSYCHRCWRAATGGLPW